MIEPIPHVADLSYLTFMRTLKEHDEALYELALEKLNPASYQTLVGRMKVDRPNEYGEAMRCLAAMDTGVGTPEVKRSIYAIADMLIKSYDCNVGFREEVSETVTVTVHLKIPELVLGLPDKVISLSDNIARDYRTARKWTFGFDNRIFVADVTWEALDALLRDPNIADVVIEPTAHIQTVTPIPDYNPAAVNTDWGVDRVHPTNAWAKGLYGEGVKVCVIDTGINASHQAFWKDGVTNFKGGINIVSGGLDPVDDHDHGTFCCGIVGHRHNGVAGQYRGIAPNVDLYAAKVLDAKGSGSLANVAAGIDWARTNGMDVVSLSLGATSGSTVLQQACDAAWYAGLVLVAAAGNNGPNSNTVAYPGVYNSCIAVAAVDYNENTAIFSSRGPQVEISAPGVTIVGPWAGFTYFDYLIPGSNQYMCANGTSAACPHVAACAALIKQWYPLATNMEIRQFLQTRARDL